MTTLVQILAGAAIGLLIGTVNYVIGVRAGKRHAAELTEMLTAATDTAMQRGYRIDELEAYVNFLLEELRVLHGG